VDILKQKMVVKEDQSMVEGREGERHKVDKERHSGESQ
jgi:hypothetical protein